MENHDPRRRLIELAEGSGASLSQLSRIIQRNPSYLQQFVRKGSPRKLEEVDRRTLARFFGVDEAELGAPEENYAGISSNSRDALWANVPRLALGASAGPGAVSADENPVGALGFSRLWLRQHGLDPAMLSVIAVSGDSMEMTLRDGDEILVDRTPAPLRDGIHVIRLDDTLLVKRVDISRPGRMLLVSDNPAYRPIEPAEGEARIVGRVVWKGGRL